MLFEIAVGDAYGAGFEYCNENLQYNDLSRYVKHTTHDIGYGRYTDDTQMSIAIAEHILNSISKKDKKTYGCNFDENLCNPDKLLSKLELANNIVNCFKRDPRVGYSHNFQKFLEDVKYGEEFLKKIRNDSDKSGAAMRACPCGLFEDKHLALEFSGFQASLTHNTNIGIFSAELVALSVFVFKHEKISISEFEKYITGSSSWDSDLFSFDWKGEVKSKGNMSVSAALTAVARNNSLANLLIDCVSFSGDVDTVAAIALGIASVSDEYVKDLPDSLTYGLENTKYGTSYLKNLDQILI